MRPRPMAWEAGGLNEAGAAVAAPARLSTDSWTYSVTSTPSKVMSPSGLWTKPVTLERIGT